MEKIFVDTSALYASFSMRDNDYLIALPIWKEMVQRGRTLNTANRRQLSLVDYTGFETMRHLGIEKVFTFDEHFREQGFELIP
jgi:predicted nucleic acid-binding protein